MREDFARVCSMLGRAAVTALLLSASLISLAHAQTTNLVTNGTFETNTSGWTFYTNGAGTSSSVTPGSAGSSRAIRLAITTQGTNVQLYQSGIALQPNTQYHLTFDAWSNSGHDLDVTVQKHGSPYTNYGLSGRRFDLTPGWQTFTVTFTTRNFSAPVTDARLMFWLAAYDAAGDMYYLDNIVLEKVEDVQPTPPNITLQPAGVTINAGQTATFTVAATGTAPLSYQWEKNGAPVSGATGASYTTPPALPADSGAIFRCIVSNSVGKDTSDGALLLVRSGTGPTISVWYGTNQTIGRIGTPQRWVNIPGNVSDPDGVASLRYSLNGGASVALSIGANQRRLVRKGDFNIDIAVGALRTGQNSVAITALDSTGQTSAATVTMTKVAGTVWPLTYDVAWTWSSSLTDSTQVVDGKWAVVSGGVRPLERGYDRLIALGDTTWTDYEVTALVTVHGIDSTRTAYDSVNAAPGLGFIFRWNGHTDKPNSGPLYAQPKSGYLPLGAIGWYTWRNGFNNGRLNRWEILGNENLQVKDQNSTVPLPYGVPHYFKMRVTTVPGQGGLYRFKSWPASQSEPSAWMLSGQESLTGPQRGGMLLVSHHVDATIGTISVRPVSDTPPPDSSLGFKSDDFQSPVLNTSLWTFINPRSDATLSVVGAGTADARLAISVPAGVSHDVWSGNFAPRIMQPAANSDFELEVKFDSPQTAQYQVQGVIVQQDNNNYIRIDVVRDKSGPRLFAASFVGGVPTARADTRIASGAPLYLRVRRQGNSWTPLYSFNGSTWTTGTTFTHTLTVTQVGPFIGNHGVPASASPAFTGLIDYFFDRAKPIVPEDGISDPDPSSIASDQFNAPSLDASAWTFVNPLGDATLGMTGSQLSLTLPAGVSHDVWTSGNLAPRVMQSVANEDFDIQMKFDSPLSKKYQMQGLIVQQDASRFLRIDTYHDGSTPHVFAVSFANGQPTVYGDVTVASGGSSYLRVRRQGNLWTVSFSSDGVSWAQVFSFSYTTTVTSVGPFAANHGVPASSSPGWTALFDYFVNNTSASGSGPVIAGVLNKSSALVPDQFMLVGNYPNPFNPTTTIRYGLPERAAVSMKVYSMLGQEVISLEDGEKQAGFHEVVWNGRNSSGAQVSTGVFFCRMVATGVSGERFTAVHRLVLVK